MTVPKYITPWTFTTNIQYHNTEQENHGKFLSHHHAQREQL